VPEVLTILITCPAGTKVATPCLAGIVCSSGILSNKRVDLQARRSRNIPRIKNDVYKASRQIE
jgi:hypothetical protein